MARRKWELASAPEREAVTFTFEGNQLVAKRGESLQVALLANGVDIASRSVKYHRPRGAFCLANSCGQCWMRVDDVPNRAACATPVRAGLVATRENAFPNADTDIFRAADFAFPGGLDHHSLGTTPLTPLNELIGTTARQMAGMGTVSKKLPPPAPDIPTLEVDVAIVGGGPAGLGAAEVVSQSGRTVVLIESRTRLGGQLRSGLFGELSSLPGHELEALKARGCHVWRRSIAIGLYDELDGRRVLLVRRRRGNEHLAIVHARAIILASGGYEQVSLHEGNDLPGHYGARALAELINRHGVLPGKSVAIVDRGSELGPRLEERLGALGIAATRLVDREIVEAKGRSRVKALVHVGPDGDEVTTKCDLVAIAGPVSPGYELAHQGGCALDHRPDDGGFFIRIDHRGRTTVPGVFAAGEAAGACTVAESLASGEEAGRAAVDAIAED